MYVDIHVSFQMSFIWSVAVVFFYTFLRDETSAFVCNDFESICETSLEIYTSLTMFHKTEKAVFPSNGRLYRYDVTNTSSATPINIDDVITADGWEMQRVVIVANGTLPGPTITVYEDQTLIVHVTNKLYSDTVSIHWHGLPQRGTPYMDGVGFVTQCPINPGQTFTYTFKARPSGTYWYHSHVGAQRAKGLYGALVIKERHPPQIVHGVAEEFIMQIQDWNHDYDVEQAFLYSDAGVFLNRTMIRSSVALDGSKFNLWYAESALINGKGRYYHPITQKHNEAPLENFQVEVNKSYRFRVINAAAMYPYRISVDSHSLTVIATDGHYIKPVVVESLIIHPGERFDFIISANNSIGNYMIRGHTLEINRRTIAEAVLHYKGAVKTNKDISSNGSQCSTSNKCLVLNCPFSFYPKEQNIQCITIDEVKSYVRTGVPDVKPDAFEEHFLNFAFPGPNVFPDPVNGIGFKSPTVSAISQPAEVTDQCSNADCGEEKICICTHSIALTHTHTIQLVILNMGKGKSWSHPVHMHGHSFQVLKMGYGSYNVTTGHLISQNPDIDCRGGTTQDKSFCNDATWSDPSWLDGNIPGLNLVDPPYKDTIIAPSGGYVVVRIKADNPGLWMIHCHIQLHSTDGMSLLLNESFPHVPPVPEGFPTCRSFGKHGNSITCCRKKSLVFIVHNQ
jgi:FtsP/CotA-like multicopper oxidase with cupredoxin domain